MTPGYCAGDLTPIENACQATVELGPKDLRQLPAFFQQEPLQSDYGEYDIEIIAEINHCPRLSLDAIIQIARGLADDGADVIDVGCDPGETWAAVGETVAALRDAGHRVSIDSFDVKEIENATRAGAELVLSVNRSNRDAAPDWGVEVVAIPDEPSELAGLDATIERLDAAGVSYRVDPVLEPIGVGFAESLGRYLEVRRRMPDAEIMMGIGNLTEMTDVDSAGINVLLFGICQELGIRSVLTTQVIPWWQTSVRECDLARRLMRYATRHHVVPKHIEPRLVTLRDAQPVVALTHEGLDQLAAELRDSNYRIHASEEALHLVASKLHLSDDDPFALFDALTRAGASGGPPKNLDISHAFYLGYELCKAATVPHAWEAVPAR